MVALQSGVREGPTHEVEATRLPVRQHRSETPSSYNGLREFADVGVKELASCSDAARQGGLLVAQQGAATCDAGKMSRWTVICNVSPQGDEQSASTAESEFRESCSESQVPSMTAESLLDRNWSARQHCLIRGSANAQICKTVLARRRRTDPRVQNTLSPQCSLALHTRASAMNTEISSSTERRTRGKTAQHERAVDAETVISSHHLQMLANRPFCHKRTSLALNQAFKTLALDQVLASWWQERSPWREQFGTRSLRTSSQGSLPKAASRLSKQYSGD